MTVTIAEELLLLAHAEDDGRPLIGGTQLDPALAGAILAELAINERIELSAKKVSVRDATPLGAAELDASLARMAEERRERKPAWWVQKLYSAKLRNRLLTGLADAGVLSERPGRVLGVFPTARWPEVDGSVEAEVRSRVAAALAGQDPDPRTAVLIALMRAAKLDRKAFPGADKKRIKEIAEGAWAADAVAQTIAAINSVVVTAAIAAGAAAVGGGSS